MYYLRAVFFLTLVYLALTANLQVSNIVIGFLLAVGILALLNSPRTPVAVQHAPAALWAMLRYVLVLSYDLIVSGFQVARIVLSRSLPIKPGIIAIPSNSRFELAEALSAHAITLTPGELVVEIDADGVMYTHVLDASETDKQIAQAQQMRIDLLEKIFPEGTVEDRAAQS